MKYLVTFVFWYIDGDEITNAEIYKITVAGDRQHVLIIASEQVKKVTDVHTFPGWLEFVSMTDEDGRTYIEKNKEFIIPEPSDNLKIQGIYGMAMSIFNYVDGVFVRQIQY